MAYTTMAYTTMDYVTSLPNPQVYDRLGCSKLVKSSADGIEHVTTITDHNQHTINLK